MFVIYDYSFVTFGFPFVTQESQFVTFDSLFLTFVSPFSTCCCLFVTFGSPFFLWLSVIYLWLSICYLWLSFFPLTLCYLPMALRLLPLALRFAFYTFVLFDIFVLTDRQTSIYSFVFAFVAVDLAVLLTRKNNWQTKWKMTLQLKKLSAPSPNLKMLYCCNRKYCIEAFQGPEAANLVEYTVNAFMNFKYSSES